MLEPMFQAAFKTHHIDFKLITQKLLLKMVQEKRIDFILVDSRDLSQSTRKFIINQHLSGLQRCKRVYQG